MAELGDNGFTIPALIELRERYGEVYLSCYQKAVTAFKDTGLIDRFLIRHSDMEEATEEQKWNWLLHMISDMVFAQVWAHVPKICCPPILMDTISLLTIPQTILLLKQ